MKIPYTKQEIVDRLIRNDVRLKKLQSDQIDVILNRGYAELAGAFNQAFSNEEVIDLEPIYQAGEQMASIDIEADVIDIYDMYLTKEDPDSKPNQGVSETRDNDLLYRDNRYVGRIHFRASLAPGYDNIVVKHYYTPEASDETIYLDNITRTALDYALSAAAHDYNSDPKKQAVSYANMLRIGSQMPYAPEDVPVLKHSMFP